MPRLGVFSGPTILPNLGSTGTAKLADIIPSVTSAPVNVWFFKLAGSLSLDLAKEVFKSTVDIPP